MLNVISLGAGVQSSALALMAATSYDLRFGGPVDAAIFADTGNEPKAVYDWLEWLIPQLEPAFPVYVVRALKGEFTLALRSSTLRLSEDGTYYAKAAIPAYIKSPEGKVGIMNRQCTNDFKIQVINRTIKRLIKQQKLPGQKLSFPVATKDTGPEMYAATTKYAREWMGISADEAGRMRDNREMWIKNHYPLVAAGYTRAALSAWVTDNFGKTPPRSACIFCPFRRDEEWLELTPDEFLEAVAYERAYQTTYSRIIPGIPYLHPSLVPLDQVKFKPKGGADRAERLPGAMRRMTEEQKRVHEVLLHSAEVCTENGNNDLAKAYRDTAGLLLDACINRLELE